MSTNKVQPPDGELVDTYLTEREYDACADELEAIQKARAKYRAAQRRNGPSGRLRRLALGSAGDSHVFTEYTRTGQLSATITAVSLKEGVQFTSRLERSLVDDSIVGVRVTVVGFTR